MWTREVILKGVFFNWKFNLMFSWDVLTIFQSFFSLWKRVKGSSNTVWKLRNFSQNRFREINVLPMNWIHIHEVIFVCWFHRIVCERLKSISWNSFVVRLISEKDNFMEFLLKILIIRNFVKMTFKYFHANSGYFSWNQFS